MYSFFLRQRSGSLSDLLLTRIFTRQMGGGPRTFPGGLNKWQWKRLHEKKAKEKERKLLDQEKQLYEARLRSEIRAKVWGKPNTDPNPNPVTNHCPVSPKEHIKALADRFMKAGAVDLWNEDDGPLKSEDSSRFSRGGNEGRAGPTGSVIDVRKLVSENSSLTGYRQKVNLSSVNCSNLVKSRSYSVMCRRKSRRNESSESEKDSGFALNDGSKGRKAQAFAKQGENFRLLRKNYSGKTIGVSGKKQRSFTRNESSSDEEDSDFESKSNSVSPFTSNFVGNNEKVKSRNVSQFIKKKNPSGIQRRFRRNESSSSDEDLEFDSEEQGEQRMKGWRDMRKTGSSAFLGKYDMKITKRVPLQSLEGEVDSSQEVEVIRNELRRRKSMENHQEHKEAESIYSEKKFDESCISPLTVKALSVAGYIQMTRVQEATLSECLDGKEALVKAKTGTGKSVAFLLPAIETVLKAMSNDSNQRVPPIFVLILCPTRELASQLAAQAKALLKYHEQIGVQTLVGGTRFKLDQQRLESEPCQILVATPGRLLDHIENKSGLTVRLMGLKMLILDEVDLLLDLGFRRDVEKIVDCLPRQRQSLLFSATIPKEVRRISQLVLKREHSYIDTVGLGSVETHEKVKQSCLVAPHELHFQLVHHLLMGHIAQTPDYKIIVFCSTGMVTSLMYSLLREMRLNVREIHARKPQLYRTRISDEFKDSKQLILVTSDVSARGMNYPNVTLVVQMGIPSDREQYIHRLGRTGREGKEGEGILLLAPWEKYFLDELKDLPLEPVPVPNLDSEFKLKIEDSMAKIDSSIKEAAYHAWLGYYNSIREIGRDKTTLVELANRFCHSIGLEKPPSLYRKTAVKMGLKDIPGIRIRK